MSSKKGISNESHYPYRGQWDAGCQRNHQRCDYSPECGRYKMCWLTDQIIGPDARVYGSFRQFNIGSSTQIDL